MTFNHLMWFFAVLFGLPLAVLDDEGWRRASGTLSVLSLDGFALAMAADGLTKLLNLDPLGLWSRHVSRSSLRP